MRQPVTSLQVVIFEQGPEARWGGSHETLCVENIPAGESRTREAGAESTLEDEDRPRGWVPKGLDLILGERSHGRVLSHKACSERQAERRMQGQEWEHKCH